MGDADEEIRNICSEVARDVEKQLIVPRQICLSFLEIQKNCSRIIKLERLLRKSGLKYCEVGNSWKPLRCDIDGFGTSDFRTFIFPIFTT